MRRTVAILLLLALTPAALLAAAKAKKGRRDPDALDVVIGFHNLGVLVPLNIPRLGIGLGGGLTMGVFPGNLGVQIYAGMGLHGPGEGTVEGFSHMNVPVVGGLAYRFLNEPNYIAELRVLAGVLHERQRLNDLSDTSKNNAFGGVAGAGFEYLLTSQLGVSVNAEYLIAVEKFLVTEGAVGDPTEVFLGHFLAAGLGLNYHF